MRGVDPLLKFILCPSDDSAHGRHESLQHQRYDGIQWSTNGRFSSSKFGTHDSARVEMSLSIWDSMERQRPTKGEEKQRGSDSPLNIFWCKGGGGGDWGGEEEEGLRNHYYLSLSSLAALPLAVSCIAMFCRFPCLPSGPFHMTTTTRRFWGHWLGFQSFLSAQPLWERACVQKHYEGIKQLQNCTVSYLIRWHWGWHWG